MRGHSGQLLEEWTTPVVCLHPDPQLDDMGCTERKGDNLILLVRFAGQRRGWDSVRNSAMIGAWLGGVCAFYKPSAKFHAVPTFCN